MMHLRQIALVAASFAVGGMSQFTDCYQLQSGFGYVCSPDGNTVSYCQPDQNPGKVDSQYCDYGDCRANQDQGFCQFGFSQKNRARGPTDCSQVNPNGGYICSSDYTALYQCFGSNQQFNDFCGDRTCFASTTGDQGACIR